MGCGKDSGTGRDMADEVVDDKTETETKTVSWLWEAGQTADALETVGNELQRLQNALRDERAWHKELKRRNDDLAAEVALHREFALDPIPWWCWFGLGVGVGILVVGLVGIK